MRQRVDMPTRRLLRLCGGTPALEPLEPRALLAFDPTPNEQYMLEILNRMRMNPAAELGLMTTSLGTPARSANSDVDSALRFFNVSGPTLADQWAELSAAPPLAWNANLYNAAEFHNGQMIAADEQSHQVEGEPDLGQRATNAGYANWTNLGESVYAFARSVDHGHAGFAIDWGTEPTGIQDPPGHRNTMMNAGFREVGIRVQEIGNVAGRDVGPMVITQDFGRRSGLGGSFLLGVVFGDSNDNGYSIGEGYGNVSITAIAFNGTPGAATYTTSSMSAGGWQLLLPNGTYAVTFSGGSFGSAVTYRDVVVSGQNIKLDAKKGVLPPEPDAQVWSASRLIPAGDTTPAANDNTDFGNANRDGQTITKEFQLYNAGKKVLTISGFPRITITGANASNFMLVQSAVTSSLAVDGRANFKITFDPSIVGLHTATVTITTNDPDSPAYTFKIQGRGVRRPIASVSGKQTLIANGDSTPTTADWTNFGGVNMQGASKVRIFTITNTGLSPLTFASATPVTLSGAGAAYFKVFVQPPGSVAPGASVQFRVRFTPSLEGFAPAIVTLNSSDPVTAAYTFTIRGTGLALPRMLVTAANITILSGDDTPALVDKTNFGTVNASSGNRVRLFTITNTGLGILNLTGTPRVIITGTNASAFVVSVQPAVTSLDTGESTTFRIRFDPADLGLNSAMISILSNDQAGGGAYSFAIGGIGA